MEHRLSTNIDITSATELRQQFLTLMKEQRSITFDAAQVSKMDAAGLQLLASLVMSAKHNEVEIRWKDLSPALIKNVEILGYDLFAEHSQS